MRSLMLAAGALCCLAAGAHAAVITQTQRVSFSNPDGQGINQLVGFDTRLGTLTDAGVTLTGTYREDLRPDLFPADPIPVSSMTRTVVSVFLLGQFHDLPLVTMSFPYDAAAGVFHVVLPISLSFALSTVQLTYAGDGPSIEVDTGAGTFPGVGGSEYVGSPGIEGQITLTYTYTPSTIPAPVPEPASAALLGCGLVGILSISRTRRIGPAKPRLWWTNCVIIPLRSLSAYSTDRIAGEISA